MHTRNITPSTRSLNSRRTSLRRLWRLLRGASLAVCLLGAFSLSVLAVPSADFSAITVGPNPLRPMLNPGQVMTFRNVPAGTRVRMFTYTGEKVVELADDGSGNVVWDGKNRLGSYVASGVYIVLFTGDGGKRTMRVAIER